MHPLVLESQAGACPECQMPLEQIPGVAINEKPAEPEKPKWTCPMHPEVVKDEPGICPKCKMDLEKMPPKPGGRLALTVPITAVLDSGLRKLVYVEKGKGYYVPVAIETGPRTDDGYLVLNGLKDGDKVVTHGGFLLDSQFQIRGLPSLINPEVMTAPAHNHSQHTAPTQE